MHEIPSVSLFLLYRNQRLIKCGIQMNVQKGNIKFFLNIKFLETEKVRVKILTQTSWIKESCSNDTTIFFNSSNGQFRGQLHFNIDFCCKDISTLQGYVSNGQITMTKGDPEYLQQLEYLMCSMNRKSIAGLKTSEGVSYKQDPLPFIKDQKIPHCSK